MDCWSFATRLVFHGLLTISHTAGLSVLQDDPKVPLQLLIFAVETAITTLTCIADYLSYPGYSDQEKLNLGQLYVPYLALCMYLVFVENGLQLILRSCVYGGGYVWQTG